MKNSLANLKNPTTVLSILAILLIIAQIAVMFIPCFNMTPVATRKNPNPQPKEYSLFSFCWSECEEMNKIIKKQVDDYQPNDFAMGIVLPNAFGLLTIIFMVIELKNLFQNYKVGGAKAVKILSNLCCLLWGGLSVYGFMTSPIFGFCVEGSSVQMIQICIGAAGLVIALIRAAIAFAGRTRYVVKAK